jgi:hypothetical protein
MSMTTVEALVWSEQVGEQPGSCVHWVLPPVPQAQCIPIALHSEDDLASQPQSFGGPFGKLSSEISNGPFSVRKPMREEEPGPISNTARQVTWTGIFFRMHWEVPSHRR